MTAYVPGAGHAVPLDAPLDRSWVARPAALYRYSRALGVAWADGFFLTAWPRVAQIVMLIAFLIGLGAGATHWTPAAFGVISETGIYAGPFPAGAYVTVFAQSIPFLVVAAFLGAISARAGLLLTLGYALGDYLIAGPQFGVPAAGYPVTMFGFSNPYLSAFCYVRLPQLLMYALLLLLAVMPTLATASLVQGLRPLGRYLGNAKRLAGRYVEVDVRVAVGMPMGKVAAAILAVGRIALLCAVQWWLVYTWTLAAAMIFRIPWLWAGQPPPIPVFVFLAVIGSWVTNAAIAGILLRGILVLLANRNPAVRTRAGRLLLAQAAVDRRRAGSRLPTWASSALRSVALGAFIALILSGYDSDPVVGMRIFAFAAGMLVLRSSLLPLLPPWRLWVGVVNKVPAIARLAPCAVVLPPLTMWYFLYAPGASVQANAATGSFGAQIVAMGLGLILLVVLLPGAQRGWSGGLGREARAGGQAPGRRVPGRRIAVFGISFMLLGAVFDLPTQVFGACLDPHCCFNVDNGLAALVVGGTAILIFGLGLLFAPETGAVDVPEIASGARLAAAGLDEVGGFDGLMASLRSATGRMFMRGAGNAAGDATPDIAATDTGATDASVDTTPTSTGAPPEPELPVQGDAPSNQIVNSHGDPYPDAIDIRTGERVPFPRGALRHVPKEDRVPWNRKGDFSKDWYIRQWYERGYSDPPSGWRNIQIHHIHPREFGGSNDFDNLVPLSTEDHIPFNTWWRHVDPLIIEEIIVDDLP